MSILRKLIFIIIILISLSTVSFAQRSFIMKGQIMDGALNEPLIAAAVAIKGKPVGTATDFDGKFTLEIVEKYWNDTIVVSMLGYVAYKIAIKEVQQLPNYYLKTTLAETSFNLEMAEIGAPIILNNIFFEFNRHELLPTSFRELEKLYNFLTKNEAVVIEIAGHTDSIGTQVYNAALSEARASSVMAYLEEKGIDQNRMTARGYGKERPVVSNGTEKERAMNRRVEFTVISKGEVVNTSQMPDTTRKITPVLEVPPINGSTKIILTPPTNVEEASEEIPIVSIINEVTISNKINAIVTDYAVNKGFNGAIMVYQNAETLYKNGVGFSDFEQIKANTAQTKFYIGAISEQFTTVLILKLVKSKKLDLTIPIKHYLDGLPKVIGEKVTISQLLSHTSGICEEAVTNLDLLDLCFVPNLTKNYSATNYVLLGKILEKIYGDNYSDIVETQLIKPLELTQTKVVMPTLKAEKIAKGYRKEGEKMEEIKPLNNYREVASNGVMTTIEDLMKWEKSLKNVAWLSPDLQLLMETPAFTNQTFCGEVKQVVMEDKVLEVIISEGSINGHNALIIRTKSGNSIITILSNIENANLQPLYRAILKALFI